ncbi:putative transcription factor bZIP family [Medicago truncatula]|uniref:Putative transcription factor bZIP family n=1 Tax=Medicago truncatula TaxID=3880 RepID=A0A072UQN2_MEDTR|nr:putative leucine-rich repeat-containing protein DDB_G0290503 [Medicago truncatula]KEH31977.1 WEAK movement UNDER BLUE LIGHT-like protein [Medicago truncatula]RHN63702.1 putative transcription factor bZIP family [Medicago truncatula]
MVGEIDTTPIEPVRHGVSLFDDKGDNKKFLPRNKRDYEKEIEDLTTELASYKVQLEAKHVAHIKALLKPEQNQKMIQELSTLLKNSDIERNKYVNEHSEGRASSKDELESMMKEMADLRLETVKVRDQLSHVLSELKSTQRELLNKDTDIFAARDSELNAVTKAEQLENELKMEKEQKEELLHQVNELNERVHRSKLAAIKVEKQNIGMLYQKDEEIQLATKDNDQAQQEIVDMRKNIDMLHGLQNKQMVDETLTLSEDSPSNAIKDLYNDIEQKERYIMDQSSCIDRLEMELNQLKNELTSAKEEINELNINNESLTSELHRTKEELKTNKERDIDAQVEIALLKSHLQEYRLAYKDGYITDHSKGEAEENNDSITISLEDYNYMIKEVQKGNKKGNQIELALMKKELENASLKISEMRTRAEQAISRAELAENGKAALEDKIRRHREHRLRKKAALTALREESTPKPFTPSTSYGTPSMYQPLSKVLNIKL